MRAITSTDPPGGVRIDDAHDTLGIVLCNALRSRASSARTTIVNRRVTCDIACSLLFLSRQPNLCHFESACQHIVHVECRRGPASLTAPRQRDSVGHIGEEKRMSKLRLTFACGPTTALALRDGSIAPEGIELNYIASQPPDIFWRMLQFKEFEISEMSLSNHATLVSTGELPFIAIPVFPSRVFRHGYFFINTDKGIESPTDLKGKRGGVPEYTMTAAVYMRGVLQHEYGVKPSDVEWVQGRADRLGRKLPRTSASPRRPPVPNSATCSSAARSIS